MAVMARVGKNGRGELEPMLWGWTARIAAGLIILLAGSAVIGNVAMYRQLGVLEERIERGTESLKTEIGGLATRFEAHVTDLDRTNAEFVRRDEHRGDLEDLRRYVDGRSR